MKKKRNWFLLSLGIYALILLVAIGIGLNVFWNYLEAYEASLPDTAMAAYMEIRGDDFWKAEAQRVVSEGFNEFADHNATIADYGIDPEGTVIWSGKGEGSNRQYEIRIGAVKICTVKVVPGEEVGFGLSNWVITGETFDFGTDTEVTVAVPTGAVPTINGVPVGTEYKTGEGTLSVELNHEFDMVPASEIYVIGGLRGPVELKAADAQGAELEAVQIGEKEFHFVPRAVSLFRFVAPTDAVVSVNGVDIAAQYAEEAAPELAPGRLGIYEASELYHEPEISVVWNGKTLDAVELSTGTFYIPGGGAQLEGELAEFADGFTHAYVDFMANKNRTASYNFSVLAPYLIRGSDLYASMNETRENIVWAKTSGLTYHETSAFDHIELGDGSHLCYVSYDVSYVFQGNPRDVAETMALRIIVDENGDYKVEEIAPVM